MEALPIPTAKFSVATAVAPKPTEAPPLDLENLDLTKCGLETLYPVSLLISELQSDDLRTRLEAVKKIPKIAEQLGHERTRKDILPFFTEALCDEDDVLYALAELLGNFVHLIGGRQYTQLLLPPLERLATLEDARVRNRAVLSLRILAGAHTQQNLELHYIPMVKRLSKCTKASGRAACSSLISACYKRVRTTARSDLRTTYRMLCTDKYREIRESAAEHLGDLARVIESEYLRSYIMPIFVAFSHDHDDTVRVLTILACYRISQVLSAKYKEQLLLSFLNEIVRDPSWRVRVEIANRIVKLAKGLGPDLSKKGLINIFVTLLKDQEACVRAMVLSRIILFARKLDRKSQAPFIINSVMPHIDQLINDSAQQVKMTLAAMTIGFCRIVDKAETLEHVVPIIIKQLNSDCPQARSAIVSRLDIVLDVIGAKHFEEFLLSSMVQICNDTHWETRFCVIDSLPPLATQLGVDDFDRQFTPHLLNYLHDPVFMVRDKSASMIKTLMGQFGVEWCDRMIVPKLQEMAAHVSCVRRMTVLFVINKIAEVAKVEIGTKHFLPLVRQLAEDPVPNIRFNAAKTTKVIGPVVDPEAVEEHLKPILAKLMADEDVDVKFYAEESQADLFPEVDTIDTMDTAGTPEKVSSVPVP